MNKHFFELPKAVKRAVWAALMAEWAKKKSRQPHHRLTARKMGFEQLILQ